MGYGKISIDDVNMGSGTFKISVSNSFEADQTDRSSKSGCLFVLSYLKGLFSQLTGKDLGGEEIECRGKGDLNCKFKLSALGHLSPKA